jgi:hypothetical protein
VNSKAPLISRTADLIVEDVGEEALIYDTRSDVAHSLSATAAVVWRAARSGETLDGISELLRARGIEGSEDTAVAVVAELQEKDLLESRNFDSPTISRRRALQRMAAVGAAAAAVPFVVSATVPTAQAAGSPASCVHQGSSCTPQKGLFAANDCCRLSNGNQTDAMYCTANSDTPAHTCQPCIATGQQPGAACVSNIAYRCCSGACGTGTNANNCS